MVSPEGAVERCHRLTDPQLAAVAELEQRCAAVDGGRLKLEWDTLRRRDGRQLNDLVFSEQSVVLGFCGIYSFGGPVSEVTGMVDPAVRRRGIGTALLFRLDLARRPS